MNLTQKQNMADSVADKSFASSYNTERNGAPEHWPDTEREGEDSKTPMNKDRPKIDRKSVRFGTEESGLPEDQEWAEDWAKFMLLIIVIKLTLKPT